MFLLQKHVFTTFNKCFEEAPPVKSVLKHKKHVFTSKTCFYKFGSKKVSKFMNANAFTQYFTPKNIKNMFLL